MSKPAHEELMSTNDIAREARVDRTTVWRWHKAGKLGKPRVQSGNFLFHFKRVQKFLNARAKRRCRR